MKNQRISKNLFMLNKETSYRTHKLILLKNRISYRNNLKFIKFYFFFKFYFTKKKRINFFNISPIKQRSFFKVSHSEGNNYIGFKQLTHLEPNLTEVTFFKNVPLSLRLNTYTTQPFFKKCVPFNASGYHRLLGFTTILNIIN